MFFLTFEETELVILQLHWPFRTKPGSRGWEPEVMAPLCLPETWAAMEGLYESGKAKAIGVSNFSTKKLQNLISIAKVPPAVNQVECHPVWKQSMLHNFCKSTGVHLTVNSNTSLHFFYHFFWYFPFKFISGRIFWFFLQAYSPLGSPGSWIKGEILKEPALIETAEKLKKSPAQVALRWGIQSGHSVLPKSVNELRIKENLDLFSWSIPLELMANISAIPQVSCSASVLLHMIRVFVAYKVDP